MKTASTVNQKHWFSLGLGQVITTLGHLASVLPEEQLDKELTWLVNEVERLQSKLPADMAFCLLTTLKLCIKAAVTKSCRALDGTVPTVLAALHHLGTSHMDRESDVEEETIRILISQFLNKIALRHKNTDEGFWKEILNYMLEADYTSSVPVLCQMLLVVDKKASINFNKCAKEIPIHSLFTRLLVISSYPRWDVERGTSVLALLERLIPANYPFLVKLFRMKIPPLITYLEASTERTFDLAQWKCTLVSFLGSILKHVPYREWHVSFMEELTVQIDSFAHHENEEGFIFQCLGKCLASCDDTALILPFLRSMFESTRFIATPYHAGIVIGFQTCAKVHPIACWQVLEAYKDCLSAIELDPYNLLEEVTPPEYKDDFNIPTFAAEKHLEDMIKMMKSTLRLCEFILSN